MGGKAKSQAIKRKRRQRKGNSKSYPKQQRAGALIAAQVAAIRAATARVSDYSSSP